MGMKSTVDISDALLLEAKALARSERTTLRALIERGLREVLAAHRAEAQVFRLKDIRFGGQGLSPELEAGDWSALRTLERT